MIQFFDIKSSTIRMVKIIVLDKSRIVQVPDYKTHGFTANFIRLTRNVKHNPMTTINMPLTRRQLVDDKCLRIFSLFASNLLSRLLPCQWTGNSFYIHSSTKLTVNFGFLQHRKNSTTCYGREKLRICPSYSTPNNIFPWPSSSNSGTAKIFHFQWKLQLPVILLHSSIYF